MKKYCLLAFLLGFSLSFAHANNVEPLFTTTVPLEITPVSIANPPYAPANHIFITGKSRSYDFLLMSGFRTETVYASDELRIVKLNNACWMSFRIYAPNANPNVKPLTTATATNYLADEFPKSRITGQFALAAAGAEGPAFDLLTGFAGAAGNSIRIAFIPTAKGILEFRLFAPTRYFNESLNDFRDFMSGFRVCPNGRADLLPPPKTSADGPSGN